MKPLSFLPAAVLATAISGLALGATLGLAKLLQTFPGLIGTGTNPQLATPLSTVLVATGHDYFSQSCATCHGDDARGEEGPDLHHLTISDGRIAKTIKHGVPGEMPSFAKKYGEVEIKALRAYLRSLGP
jgi:mono/diheme cytochrome c family protein